MGWSGILLGAAIVARGFAVAFTGFSLANPINSPLGGVALNLLNVWLLILGVHIRLESVTVEVPSPTMART